MYIETRLKGERLEAIEEMVAQYRLWERISFWIHSFNGEPTGFPGRLKMQEVYVREEFMNLGLCYAKVALDMN